MRAIPATVTAVVLGLGARASAQGTQVITTLTKDGKPLADVKVELVVDGQPRTLGVTDASGRLSLGSATADGPVVHVRCPANAEDAKSSQKKLNHQLFISEVVDEFLLTGNPGDMRFTGSYNRPFGPLLCKVTPLPPMRRGKNYEARLEPGELKGRSFGAALPIGLAVAAGASATYFAATSGSESDDAPGGGNNPSFGNVLGTYNFNGSVQQRGACNFNNFQSRVTFSGSQDALNADLLEALLRAYRGTARPEGSGFQFNTSASGTVPSLGSYTGTLIGLLFPDGTATATETLNFPCGTVTIAQSGRKQ